MTRMQYVHKTCLEGTFTCTSSFLVCARLTTCVRVHTLEGTLLLRSIALHQPILGFQ